MSSTQAGMYCRVVPTARQLKAAELMVIDGLSATRALVQAGYAPSSARNPSHLIRRCKGLRSALRMVQERSCRWLTNPAPPRKRKYDRRTVARIVSTYVYPDVQNETSNAAAEYMHRQAQRAKEVVERVAKSESR